MTVNPALPVGRIDEKERIICGTLLSEFPTEVPPVITELLRAAPESFQEPRHGQIAVAIREVASSLTKVQVLSVRDWLERAQRLEEVGGQWYLSELSLAACRLDLAEHEAEPIWEAYCHRLFRAACAQALEKCKRGGDLPHVVAELRRKFDVIAPPPKPPVGLTIRQPDEILAMTFDEVDNLLGDRLLCRGESLVIAGQGGVGKSRLLLQLAVSVILSQPFCGLPTRGGPLRWLVLQAENSNRRLRSDLEHLRSWIGVDRWPTVNEHLRIHTLETETDAVVSLADDGALQQIRALIAAAQPDVIALDALGNFVIGDPNKDEDMRATVTALSRLTKAGNPNRSLVILHHALTGRAGAAKATGYERAGFGRNSKVLHAWTAGQLNVAPGSPHGNDVLVISCAKNRNGREFAPFAVRLDAGSMIYAPDSDFDLVRWQGEINGTKQSKPQMTPDRARELCSAPKTKKELASAIREDCGCSRESSYRYAQKAVKAGTIQWNADAKVFSATE